MRVALIRSRRKNSDRRLPPGKQRPAPGRLRKVIAQEFVVQQGVDIPAEAAGLRVGIQDQMSNHLDTVDIPLPVPSDLSLTQAEKTPLPELESD